MRILMMNDAHHQAPDQPLSSQEQLRQKLLDMLNQIQVPSLPTPQLIKAQDAAAMGQMSVSWWQREVRAGRAPAPVIRGIRCNRWSVAEVIDFWASMGQPRPRMDNPPNG